MIVHNYRIWILLWRFEFLELLLTFQWRLTGVCYSIFILFSFLSFVIDVFQIRQILLFGRTERSARGVAIFFVNEFLRCEQSVLLPLHNNNWFRDFWLFCIIRTMIHRWMFCMSHEWIRNVEMWHRYSATLQASQKYLLFWIFEHY